MKVCVYEVVQKKHVLEIPDVCPKCEADLTVAGALNTYEYGDITYHSVSFEKDGTPNYDNSSTSSECADTIGPTDIVCANCSEMLTPAFPLAKLPKGFKSLN